MTALRALSGPLTVQLARSAPSLAAVVAAGLLLSALPLGCGATRPARAPSAPAPMGVEAPVAAAPPEAPASAPARDRFAVASENATATRLAMAMLERGGSAVDAAIAGMLGMGVTQPVSSGLGGGGFALVWDAKARKASALDFREAAPMGLVAADFLKRPPPEKKRGAMTGVPGELAGLAELHARWGRVAFTEVVRGAAEAAETGFPVSAHLARALRWNETWVLATPRYRIFHPAGSLLSAGESAKNPALAATLRRIAAEGRAAFYEGTIASDILATARGAGSPMTAADLVRYRVFERTPLTTTWEGNEVLTMPPPSAGGVMLLEALHMHAKADLVELGYGSGAYLHLLAETFRGAVADRVHLLGDPDFVKMDVAGLVAPARMRERRARIRLDATNRAESFPMNEAGTSHLVVVDEQGDVVSITSTVNNMFGARLVTEGGFVLNDELDDFTRDKVARLFGLRRGPNAPRGGARPASSMTPTIVLRGGRPVLALGGSGGARIATGVTQVLLARLAFGRPVAQAVVDARVETPATGGLLVDAALPIDVAQDLQKRGEVVDATRPNYSAVQAISIEETGDARALRPASDPRKGGTAEVR